MRTFWTIAHRWVGLATAIFLFVAGCTGALLAFYSELDGLLNPDLLKVEAQSKPRLDLDVLTASVERALPNAVVTGVSVSEIPERTVSASIEGRIDLATGKPKQIGLTEAYVDPYDGRFLGARETGVAGLGRRQLMSFIYSLHYSMHLPGPWGTWLMGGAALLWFFDNFVGAYLTFPLRHRLIPDRPMTVQRQLAKGWWSRWKPAWLIRTSGSAYRMTFDLHRAPGLWLWLVLGMLALSSVYLNLSREVFNPIVGLFAKVTPYPDDFAKDSAVTRRLSFDRAASAARDALQDSARDLRLSFVGYNRETNVFRVGFGYPDAKTEWFKLRSENLYLDGTTGLVVGRFGSASATSGDKFNNLLFSLHSGQILGLPGRIVICITGIAVAMLSVTGVIIWLRKRRARTGRDQKAVINSKKQQQQTPAGYPAE